MTPPTAAGPFTASPAGASGQELFPQAMALHRAGRLDQAIAIYRRALEQAPGFVGGWCNLGIALKQAGHMSEALAAYREATRLGPETPDAHFNLALALNDIGQGAEAESALRQALACRADFPQAQALLGEVLKNGGRFAEARAAYEAALALRPDHLGVLLGLAEVHAALDSPAEALKLARRAAELRPGDGHLLAKQAGFEKLCGRTSEALESAQRAVAIDPQNGPALEGLVEVLRETGDLKPALEAFRRALAGAPGSLELCAGFARLCLELGDAAEAGRLCEDGLIHHPGNAKLLALLCSALTEQESWDCLSALADCDRLMLQKQWAAVPGYASVADFNAALAAHIENHPSLQYERHGTATRLGRHTGELLIEPKGPMAAFEQLICDAVAAYDGAIQPDPQHPFLANPPARWSLNVWALVMDGQGYQISHIHPSGWLSGVYYVSVPDLVASSGNAQAGWIEFGEPLPQHCVSKAAPLQTFQPEPGLMLLFPSYFFHRTIPFECQQKRICIAFDVKPFA